MHAHLHQKDLLLSLFFHIQVTQKSTANCFTDTHALSGSTQDYILKQFTHILIHWFILLLVFVLILSPPVRPEEFK